MPVLSASDSSDFKSVSQWMHTNSWHTPPARITQGAMIGMPLALAGARGRKRFDPAAAPPAAGRPPPHDRRQIDSAPTTAILPIFHTTFAFSGIFGRFIDATAK